MKKIIGFLAVFALLLTFTSSSYADRDGGNHNNQNRDRDENHSNWKLNGTCEITYTLDGGNYVHTYTLTSGSGGAFSGTGFYNPDHSYTEDINGNVTGDNLTFHVLYTGTNAGYTVDATGTISPAGILSGTALSSSSQSFTFVSTAACAQKAGDDGDEQHLKLNWKSELTPGKCNASGDPVINVEEKVKNDVDSGFGASVWWAIDNYNRHIKVWPTGEDSWCATVAYEGQFNAVKGQDSPGGTGKIGSNIKGEMKGGYRATFTGTLKSSPLWPTHGSVGTVNYGCTIAGSGSCTYVSWTGQYFDGVGAFAQPWWGWIYNAEHHGTWINASSGSAGDIL